MGGGGAQGGFRSFGVQMASEVQEWCRRVVGGKGKGGKSARRVVEGGEMGQTPKMGGAQVR